MDEKIAFGQRLLECRKKSGKSQAEIAKLLDITTAAYQNYENGRREAGYAIISKLANFYCVTTDYLLGRTEPAEHLNPITQMTNEEMEQRLLKAYFSLPQKLRNDFLNGMAEQLEKQHEAVAQADGIQQLASEANSTITVQTAARPAPGGKHEPIREKQMTPEEVTELFDTEDADDL